ncbi:TetR/AcrR family transcriptional regulator (plasmid) [Rhodococcus qingshengii]|uniref:TetR/AcrR family transcriptional regulator n=1 Tax=Rhodococcus qingshengii TaxID=334542 RepID=UPI002111B37C|nr:TetR/AcrR family transcriptional regulator [Rhodococcus qingshengii]UUE28658.1 TetR/AcrR family transcriptional regulator [Rhodococcus qingshengii]
MTTPHTGLREQKKRATRAALQDAALRLALERGPENVRVDDIADAAGVSPRTYNNYFSSREQAIVSAVTAERELRIAAALVARPAAIRLSEAIIEAIIDQYSDRGDYARDALLMITTSPTLQAAYVDAVAMDEGALAEALIERTGSMDPLTAQVLAASVGAAAKVALQGWLKSAAASPSSSGVVVPSGSLPDRMRAALMPLAPALEAAATRHNNR